MTIGVYRVSNVVTGDFYIGSSNNVERRFHEHATAMHSGKHPKKQMALHWNLYGKSAFRFEILEVVPNLRDLKTRESQLTQRLQPTYNTLRVYHRPEVYRKKEAS